MARASKRSGSVTLTHPVKVTVTPARFHEFASLRQLDVARLKRAARQRIEVGYFESDCCRRMVHAVVQKGRVTKLELEPCKGETPATPELTQVIKASLRRLGARPGGSRPLPMPIEKFMSNAAGFVIQIWGCIKICCFGYCLFCCYDISRLGFWGFCKWERLGGTSP